MNPLAFVIQRYGADVDGGAEQHCRELARRAAARWPVEILTTCARDYVTWNNSFPPGESQEDGISVRRFAVQRSRDIGSFNKSTSALLGEIAPSTAAQHKWVKEQGPYCPALLSYLARHSASYSSVIFYTYLYYPTVYGLKLLRGRGVFVPTAHDEPVARLPIYRRVFHEAGGFLFLTEPERQFVERRFGSAGRPQGILGTGIEAPAQLDPRGFRDRYGVRAPYLFYAGRIDAGKGCAQICDYFLQYKQTYPGPLQLLFAGKLHMELPPSPDIRYLGFLPRRELWNAYHGALAVCASSPFESLSLLALEAFAAGAPVLANGHCPVLAHHCANSQAGFPYLDGQEFIELIRFLLERPGLARELGQRGRAYIAQQYRWDRTIQVLEDVLRQTASLTIRQDH